MRALSTSAYYLMDEPKQGWDVGMIMEADGRTKFYPLRRKSAGFLWSLFGFHRNHMDKPLRFPGGITVYPILKGMLSVNDPLLSEYASRLKQDYDDIDSPNQLYLLARKVWKYYVENEKHPSKKEIEDMIKSIGETEEEKQILDMNKKELRKYWSKNKIGRGVLPHAIGGQVIDFFSLQEYALDEGREKDFETAIKAERMDVELGKRENKPYGLSPSFTKIVIVIILLAVAVGAFFLVMNFDKIQHFFGGMLGG